MGGAAGTNIFLIGMPGAGKSTIGVLLAKALGMSFIDTDLLIQERENRLLQNIIDDDGVERFLKIEEEVILRLKAEHAVIATGGSAVYGGAAMAHLRKHGRLVYLKLEYNEMEKRMKNMKNRGIAIGKGQNLRDLYIERVPLYEKHADRVLDCTVASMEEAVTRIRSIIEK